MAPQRRCGWEELYYGKGATRFVPRLFVRSLQRMQRAETNPFLQHPMYAPVSAEVFTESLEVEGQVPDGLEGVYIRTGPNPQHRPWGGLHWFDGEAMVHAVRFEGGKAKSYGNHWLRTFRFCVERAAGCDLYIRLGDLKGAVGVLLMMLVNALRPLVVAMPPEGKVAAGPLGNTALTVHGGRVLALMEGGLPVLLRLCAGAVRSLGAFTFRGGLTHEMTAHPKPDPHTGELVAFAYQVQTSHEHPHAVVYYTVSPSGEVSRDHPVDVSRPQMMHDFAITETFAIFMDHAVVFDPEAMVRNNTVPFVMDKSRSSRVGLLRRDAPEAGTRWFDVKPFACFHTATAWDDGDMVHLVLCKMNDIDISLSRTDESGSPVEHPSYAVRLSIDTLTGETRETMLTDAWSLDFPVVPPSSIARFTPFAYMGGVPLDSSNKVEVTIVTTAVVKVNLAADEGEGVAGVIEHAPGLGGGEFSFVPRCDAVDADDGYLIGYLTHGTTLDSYCVVYDAKTMSSTPVAKVRLPQRVPAGFHGMWLSKAQVAEQPEMPAAASA